MDETLLCIVTHPDGEGRAFAADDAGFEARIVAVIRRLQPAALLTHGSEGEYGHPGHVLVHQTVLHAIRHSPNVRD